VAEANLSASDKAFLARNIDDLPRLDERFGRRCVDGAPLLLAASCKRCNWDLAFERPEPEDPAAMFLPARFIGYCLAAEGVHRAETADWDGVRAAYFAGLRFAADLRLTNQLGSLIGIDVARLTLAGLARVVTRMKTRDPAFLRNVAGDFVRLAPYVLGMGEGPRVERLELAWLLHREVQRRTNEGRHGFRGFLPWQSLAAYRVYTGEKLLRRAEATAAIEDDETREREALEVRTTASSGWSETLRATGPSDWFRVRQKSEELIDRYRMVHVAILLEQHCALIGRYPDTLSSLRVPFSLNRIRYEPDSAKHGYRIVHVTPHVSQRDSVEMTLERSSQATSPD
jgi:hypothetical protein